MLSSFSNNFILIKASLEKFLHINDQQSPEFHFANFESCKSPGKKMLLFSIP